MTTVTIPAEIRKVFEEYGLLAATLEDAVATRSSNEWFAILFKSKDEDTEKLGPFWAVDFRVNMNLEWEVQNDYVGPFDSIKEFKTEKLVRTLF